MCFFYFIENGLWCEWLKPIPFPPFLTVFVCILFPSWLFLIRLYHFVCFQFWARVGMQSFIISQLYDSSCSTAVLLLCLGLPSCHSSFLWLQSSVCPPQSVSRLQLHPVHHHRRLTAPLFEPLPLLAWLLPRLSASMILDRVSDFQLSWRFFSVSPLCVFSAPST